MFAPDGSNYSDLMMAPSEGIRSPYGILLPPGGNVVAYLRSSGPQSNDNAYIKDNLLTTLSACLSKCRSGAGDIIVVLPGHSESVTGATMLDNLVAGTRIVGIGYGSAMPTFTFAATGAQWKLNKADVLVSGLRLDLGGANGVTKAVIVTGATNVIANCDIVMATSSSLDAVIGIEVGTGAARFRLMRNYLRSVSNVVVTDGVKIVAALDGIEIGNNRMFFAATEVNGLVHITAAVTNIWMHHNTFSNTVASSTACIVVDDVA